MIDKDTNTSSTYQLHSRLHRWIKSLCKRNKTPNRANPPNEPSASPSHTRPSSPPRRRRAARYDDAISESSVEAFRHMTSPRRSRRTGTAVASHEKEDFEAAHRAYANDDGGDDQDSTLTKTSSTPRDIRSKSYKSSVSDFDIDVASGYAFERVPLVERGGDRVRNRKGGDRDGVTSTLPLPTNANSREGKAGTQRMTNSPPSMHENNLSSMRLQCHADDADPDPDAENDAGDDGDASIANAWM